MNIKRILASALSLTMLASFTGCLEELELEMNTKDTSRVSVPSDNSETLQINRKIRESESPMGEEGTWTVFVYLCGSDLESDEKMASYDMQEMMESSANNNVKYIVQTGGADKWHNGVSSDAVERYEVSGGKAKFIEDKPNYNMGDGKTLADFLKWGVDKYPAANMGLILWDHGSGSVSGVCFDEYDGDSLLLKEIDAALYSVYDKMTEPFEFIGFDACLMSTVETAAILATHAKYMIASEETEPGYGWNYTALGDFLEKNPEADGLEAGKIICDSFYKDCADIGSENSCTLSVTDLSKIDSVLTAFDSYASDIYDITEDNESFSDFARAVGSCDNFGGNNRLEGYTNMVDLLGIAEAGKASKNAKAVASAINDAVVYKRNGSDHKNACGLSVFYPLSVNGSEEMQIYKDVCTSKFYLGVVDKIAHGAANSGSISSYQNFSIFDLFTNDWGFGQYEEENGVLSYECEENNQWDYIDDYEPSGDSNAIQFADDPYMDEDGNYGFELTESGLNNTESVEAIVYMLTDDMEDAIELGYSADIAADWEEGIFADNFDGYWFCLPDGQLLSAYIVSECDGYDIYSSPVKLNGEETYLRFIHDYRHNEVYIYDIWDGIEENGAASRGVKQLERGDTIIPLYDAFNIDSEEDFQYTGDAYKYTGNDELDFIFLPDGEYLYGFCINDIYGDFKITDLVNFTVEGEDIYFEDFSE